MTQPVTLTPPPAAITSGQRLEWNPELGLWGRGSAGHTRAVAGLERVHSGVESAVKLHALLQLGRIDGGRLTSAVDGLIGLQMTAGPFAGCFRWYAEEESPNDTNASFFIGLALQLLALGHAGRLPRESRARLDEALARLNVWLLAELRRESPVYPNKYLGDLVCAWLGHELLNRPAPDELRRAMDDALTYWDREYWGWGEHLSDVYAGVILCELSALLLFARTLPENLRVRARQMTRELLTIDDYYGNGPRVPQIRCYDFERAPSRRTFREQVLTRWPADASDEWIDDRSSRRYMLLPFGPLFRDQGWPALFPASRPGKANPEAASIPLTGRARANAWVAPGLRTGSLSAWPIQSGAEHQRWGLSWQTFPAAFWRPDGEWGFLRFTTRRGNDVRAHPALDKSKAYLNNALGPGDPPPIGRTTCGQHRSAWVAWRALPEATPADAWDTCDDGFWLHQLATAPVIERTAPDWHTLRLDHPEGPLRLHHFPRAGQPGPVLNRLSETNWSWTVSPPPATTTDRRHLWALTTDATAPQQPPRIHRQADTVAFAWPEFDWPDTRLDLSATLAAPIKDT